MKLTISNEDRGRIGSFMNGYCFSLDLIGDGETTYGEFKRKGFKK